MLPANSAPHPGSRHSAPAVYTYNGMYWHLALATDPATSDQQHAQLLLHSVPSLGRLPLPNKSTRGPTCDQEVCSANIMPQKQPKVHTEGGQGQARVSESHSHAACKTLDGSAQLLGPLCCRTNRLYEGAPDASSLQLHQPCHRACDGRRDAVLQQSRVGDAAIAGRLKHLQPLSPYHHKLEPLTSVRVETG